MSKLVRTYWFRETSLSTPSGEPSPNVHATRSVTTFIDDNRMRLVLRKMPAGLTYIKLERLKKILAQRNKTLLSAFTKNSQTPLSLVKIFKIQSNQFTHTAAKSKEKHESCAISQCSSDVIDTTGIVKTFEVFFRKN